MDRGYIDFERLQRHSSTTSSCAASSVVAATTTSPIFQRINTGKTVCLRGRKTTVFGFLAANSLSKVRTVGKSFLCMGKHYWQMPWHNTANLPLSVLSLLRDIRIAIIRRINSNRRDAGQSQFASTLKIIFNSILPTWARCR